MSLNMLVDIKLGPFHWLLFLKSLKEGIWYCGSTPYFDPDASRSESNSKAASGKGIRVFEVFCSKTSEVLFVLFPKSIVLHLVSLVLPVFEFDIEVTGLNIFLLHIKTTRPSAL